MFHYLCLAMLKFKLIEYLNAKFDEVIDGSSLKAVVRVANHCYVVRNKINKYLIAEQMRHFQLYLNFIQDHASGFLWNLLQPTNAYMTPQWYEKRGDGGFSTTTLKDYTPRYKVRRYQIVTTALYFISSMFH